MFVNRGRQDRNTKDTLRKTTSNDLSQRYIQNQNVEEQHESTQTLVSKRSKLAWLKEYQL